MGAALLPFSLSSIHSFNILSVQKIFQLLTKIYCDISVTILWEFFLQILFSSETTFNLCKTPFNLEVSFFVYIHNNSYFTIYSINKIISDFFWLILHIVDDVHVMHDEDCGCLARVALM